MAGNRAFFAVIPCQTWPCYAKKTLKVSILQLNPHQFVDFYNQTHPSDHILATSHRSRPNPPLKHPGYPDILFAFDLKPKTQQDVRIQG